MGSGFRGFTVKGLGVRVAFQCLPCARREFLCTCFRPITRHSYKGSEFRGLGCGFRDKSSWVWGLGPFSKHAVRRIHGREFGLAGLFRVFDSSISSSLNRDETEMFIGFVGTVGKGEDARRGGGLSEKN